MGIEDRPSHIAKNRSNPEDPFGKGIESVGKHGIEGIRELTPNWVTAVLTIAGDPSTSSEETTTQLCTIVIPFNDPKRFGYGRKEITVPNVPIIEGTYEGFSAAMEIAGFREYDEKRTVVREARSDGKRDIALVFEIPVDEVVSSVGSPGDFHKLSEAPQEALQDGVITFPGVTAEEYSFNSVIGWGNYLVLREQNETQVKLALVDLDIQVRRILEQYPLERLVQNPLSPYLRTKDDSQW